MNFFVTINPLHLVRVGIRSMAEGHRSLRRSILSAGVIRWTLAALALGVVGPLSAASLEFSELPLSAAADSAYPDLASAQDGNIYVSWVDTSAEVSASLQIARFDREQDAWGEPSTIATGSDWFLNGADTPVIAAGLRGRVAAAWYANDSDGAYLALVSTSEDFGRSWSPPARLTDESDVVEFVELAPLLNGSWLAVWLDGRDREDSDNMQLRSRVIGSDDTDTLVDARVCDCCSISTLVMPNGVVITAYRDRSEDEIRDIAYQRYSRGAWTAMPAPMEDGWKIGDCPINGPSLSRRSGNVSAAWFTAANNTPQIMTARSRNLARSWNLVARMDDPGVPPQGSVSSAVLRDGSRWVGWLESSGDYALRALNRDGSQAPIQRHSPPEPIRGTPRMLVLDNRSDRPARFLVAATQGDRVVTTIGALPRDPDAPIDDCGCSPEEAASRGHQIQGEIISIQPENDALLMAHAEVSGVREARTSAFKVDRRVLNLVQPGQQLGAYIERRDDGNWWLFSIRILPDSPP